MFFLCKGGNIMFWIGCIIGLVLGANISLFLYAIILTGKKSDEKIEEMR